MLESIVTALGRAKLAVATPLDPLNITHIAAGDGGGGYVPLNDGMTGLVNEVWRDDASAPIKDPANPDVLFFDGQIPANEGGFFVRELGLFDEDGDLIAICQTGVVEKPSDPGSATTLDLRFPLKLSSAAQIELIYSGGGAIDHQGLSNRGAADCHPISAIAGLADELEALGEATELATASQAIGGTNNTRLMTPATNRAAALAWAGADVWVINESVTLEETGTAPMLILVDARMGLDVTVTLPPLGDVNNCDIAIRRIDNSANTVTVATNPVDAQIVVEDASATSVTLDFKGDWLNLRAFRGQNHWFCIGRATGSLDSPVFTGAPTAPTPPASNSSTRLATTQFVREAQATETLNGTLKIATQTQTDTGTADDVAVTPKKLRWGFSITAAENGEIRFPSWLGGLIFKWGRVTTVTATSSVTFPTEFPLSVWNLQVLANSSNSTAQYESWAARDLTKTGFMIDSVHAGSHWYFAIGR